MNKRLLDLVKGKTIEALTNVGVEVRDQDVLHQLAGKGFKVDNDNQRVYITEKILSFCLENVPKEVKLYSRDSKRVTVLGDGNTKFCPGGTGLAVLDLDNGVRRSSTSQDIAGLVGMQNHLPQVDVVRPIVSATDYPEKIADIIEFYQIIVNTDKPFMHRVINLENVDVVLQMMSCVAGGTDNLRQHPTFAVVYCPISPLKFTGDSIRCLWRFASYGIPTLVLSMTMGGCTAPATILGQVLQINIEVLAGICFVQAFYPGAPVLYGSVSSVMDMHTGILPLGAPERPIVNRVASILSRDYGIPSVMGGLSTDSKELDEQTGFEKVMTALPLMGVTDMVYGMGTLDSASTYSFEQLVMDNEFVAAMRQCTSDYLLDTDLEEEMAIFQRLALEKEPNFLTEPHTIQNFRFYWRPSLFVRETYKTWSNKGQRLNTKIRNKAKELLAAPRPTLDKETQAEIDNLLSRVLSKRGYNGCPG